MTLFETLNNDLKDAMRSKDVVKRDVVRSVITMVKNEAINQKIEAAEMADDAIEALLKRAKKQRDEAAAQYRDGGRAELAEQEELESAVIAAYLPEQMSEDAIAAIVDEVIAEVGTENFGAVMGQVMARTKGAADGKVVQAVVKAKM